MMDLDEARALTNLIVSNTYLTLADLQQVFCVIFPKRSLDAEIAGHLTALLLTSKDLLIPRQRLVVLSFLHKIYSPTNLSPDPLTQLLSSSDSVRKTEEDFIQHLSSGNGAEVLYQSVRNFNSSTPEAEDKREEITHLLSTLLPMEGLKFGNHEPVWLPINKPRSKLLHSDPYRHAGIIVDDFIEKATKYEVDISEAGKFVGLLVAFPKLLTCIKITPENIKEVFKHNQSVALDTINLLAKSDKYLNALGEVSKVMLVMLELASAGGRHAELAVRYLLAKALEGLVTEQQMGPYLKKLKIASYAIRSGFSPGKLMKLIKHDHVIAYMFLKELFAMEESPKEIEEYLEVILDLGGSHDSLIKFVRTTAEAGGFSIGSARHFIKKSTSSCISITDKLVSKKQARMVSPILQIFVSRNETIGRECLEDLNNFCKFFRIEGTKGLREFGFGNKEPKKKCP